MRPMEGVVKDYAWGSPTAIPQILGTEATGAPVAEYWLGAHPSGPARIDHETLDALIAESPELLGEPTRERFGGKFPYLLKILAANAPLSLQAHPSPEQAAKGFADEEAKHIPIDDPSRTFKDTWPKPELLAALGPFEALGGFRDPHETAELFDALEPAQSIEKLVAPLRHRSAELALAEVFLDCLCPDESHTAMLEGVLAAAVNHAEDQGALGDFARLAIQLDEARPGDPSILAALLLNHFWLEPGQALHIPAGVLHAYVKGTGVEIMANSDNVVRGGLTPKHIDVKVLVDMLSFTPSKPDILVAEPIGPGLSRYPNQDDQFSLWRITPQTGVAVELPAQDAPRILLVIEGGAELSDAAGAAGQLRKGRAGFIEAGEQLSLRGDCLAFLAGPGISR
ncbi:mannose-6-phosphate isomerase [Propionibacterium cyclohexanicum]|uniref:mannose-6-phosphate isomerase n=1 Tax=Propionibacterium cyclohexanicum TaxID=64702 RepID=A0A1H9U0U8_9ACTN|nr:mannose-6-phosphate isomerase, class I [Propionibacterium cyclohexanicum]SES02989.1 mannose-6-phosphate isomerase [Propionibacterium cyclohexanicum]